MATVNAYAIHQIGTRVNGVKTQIPASTKAAPSVFKTTSEELAKLVLHGAAREATKEEVAIANLSESVIDTTIAPNETAKSSVGDEQPASGAVGDPKGNRKQAKAAEPAPEPEASQATQAAEEI